MNTVECLMRSNPLMIKNQKIPRKYSYSHMIIQPNESVDNLVNLLEQKNQEQVENDAEFDNSVISWIQNKAGEYQLTKKVKNDENFFGNYNVTFIGIDPVKPNQGNPVGGIFRGKIGKIFFKIQYIFQNIIKTEDNGVKVVNIVQGRFLSILPFCVILIGAARFLLDCEREEITKKYGRIFSDSSVEIQFKPPLLCFGYPESIFSIAIQLGRSSAVLVDLLYVDPKIRLGVGSLGFYFIFVRTSSIMAEKWKLWASKYPITGSVIGAGFGLIGLFLAFGQQPRFIWQMVLRRMLGSLFVVMGLLLGLSGERNISSKSSNTIKS